MSVFLGDMIVKHWLSIGIAAVFSTITTAAFSAPIYYTDRSSFESALTSVTVDSLDGISSGPFGAGFVTRPDFTFVRGGTPSTSNNGVYGCINHSGCGDNSVLGFDDSYWWHYRQDTADTYTFGSAVHGFGFDYANPINWQNTATPILDGVTALANSGFFGVIYETARTAFSVDNSVFNPSYIIMDNYTYGSAVGGTPVPSPVPLPASLPLMLVGLTGLALMARRRRNNHP